MAELEFDHLVLRYCRQIILKVMDHVRSTMRGERRLQLKCSVADPRIQKSEQNLTKAIDREAEDLILESLQKKFAKLPGLKAFTVFSEELGIKTFPQGASETEAELVVFIEGRDRPAASGEQITGRFLPAFRDEVASVDCAHQSIERIFPK